MVDFQALRVCSEKAALDVISNAANNSKQASPAQLAHVFSEIVISAIQEYDRQSNN